MDLGNPIESNKRRNHYHQCVRHWSLLLLLLLDTYGLRVVAASAAAKTNSHKITTSTLLWFQFFDCESLSFFFLLHRLTRETKNCAHCSMACYGSMGKSIGMETCMVHEEREKKEQNVRDERRNRERGIGERMGVGKKKWEFIWHIICICMNYIPSSHHHSHTHTHIVVPHWICRSNFFFFSIVVESLSSVVTMYIVQLYTDVYSAVGIVISEWKQFIQ